MRATAPPPPREHSREASCDVCRARQGGGYAYRLCPKVEPLSEACFQRTPLPFANTTQRLVLSDGAKVDIDAAIVTEGVTPHGAQWMKNPIPACHPYWSDCKTPQFAPPRGCDRSCWGSTDNRTLGYSLPRIVDWLKLPAGLAPGDYVLGWRWDWCGDATRSADFCPQFRLGWDRRPHSPRTVHGSLPTRISHLRSEQSAQIWASCSDVRIVTA